MRDLLPTFRSGVGNDIHPTAKIGANVTIGNFNVIGPNVLIGSFKGASEAPFVLGDCNHIHENTRILSGQEGVELGDWNVLHNSILLMGGKKLKIGHNCWIGQNTILDGAGGLTLGNGVRIGMNSQLWTHVASGELIEGCTLFAFRPTVIEDDVWLVGSCIVGSGLKLSYRSICLIGSVLTKDTEPEGVYAGAPARRLPNLNFWHPPSLSEKLKMMRIWVNEFCQGSSSLKVTERSGEIRIRSDQMAGEIVIATSFPDSPAAGTTHFDLSSKRYTKRLTELERAFYHFIFDHKARFIPLDGQSPAPGSQVPTNVGPGTP